MRGRRMDSANRDLCSSGQDLHIIDLISVVTRVGKTSSLKNRRRRSVIGSSILETDGPSVRGKETRPC